MTTIRYPIILILMIAWAGSLWADQSGIRDLLERAEKAYDEEMYPQSISLCNDAIAANPKAYPAYNILGMVYAKQEGQEARAISSMERSLEINPKQTPVYSAIANLLNQTGQPDEAIIYLEKGLGYEPDSFDLNFNMGITYLVNKHDPNKALEHFLKAQEKKPDFDKLEYLIGLSYFIKGDSSMALGSVTKLRQEKNEFLASSLEEHMRKAAQGKAADMTSAIKDSVPEAAPSRRGPVKGPGMQRPGMQRPGGPNVQQPKTTVNATGELIVKTQSQKAPEEKQDALGLSN